MIATTAGPLPAYQVVTAMARVRTGHFHAAELIILESEGQAERDCDGNNSQAVARDPRLETVKSSIPARQKAPHTGISRWSGEVSHYSSRGALRSGHA